MAMNIKIQQMNEGNRHDFSACNGEFRIDSKLILIADRNRISYETETVPAHNKRYDDPKIDGEEWMKNPEKAVFLAYADGHIAGRLLICKYWNNLAYIEDLQVDTAFRQRGVGTALIRQARRWTRSAGLDGIMLETQDNNVQACMFYERCGFVLRGFDTHLYKGIPGQSDEVALYWYDMFDEEE
jgi:streptothricin acetyltransferase